MQKILKKNFPILFIFAVWFIFAFPFLFKTVTPYPSKYLTTFFGPWSAYSQFASPVKNNAMPDIIGQIYPWKFFTINTYKNHEIPLWNPNSFSGTPHLANYQSAVFSIVNIGFFLMPFLSWWTIIVILQPLLAGIFTYLFMTTQLKKRENAILPSISFMFCGFITTWMGYATLGYAILFLPLALFFIEKFIEKKKPYFLVLLPLTIPLSFFSGHFQISIYFLGAIISYIIFKSVVCRNLKDAILLACSVFFGILLSMPQLAPTFELYSQSVREGIIQKIEAIPWVYLPTLLAPDYFGNPVTRNAWLGHYAEWNGYIGLLGIFFAALSFTRKKFPIIFFAILALVSLLLAFDTPALDLLIVLKIPVLSTSAASRIIVLFSFSAAVLSGFGLEYFLEDFSKGKFRKIYLVTGIFLALLLILWILPQFHIGFSGEFSAIAKSNLKFPTILLVILLFLIACLHFIKARRKIEVFLFILLILISFEMLRFSMKWLPYDPKSLVYPAVPVTSYFKKIAGYNRVFGNFGAEDSNYFNLPGVEGYDALYIKRYGQFIEYLSEGKLENSERSGVSFPKQGKYSLEGANLLGIKYIIHKISDGQNVWEFPFWKYDSKSVKLLFDDKVYQVLENTNAFPRAFLVKNIITETQDEKILSSMFGSNINLSDTAVTEEPISFEKNNGGSVEIKKYTPNFIAIQTVSTASSFLVLTDSYYPGWEAKIDGNETHIFRTDYTFRGVKIPEGRHEVTFTYRPKSFRYGVYAAIIGIIGMIFLLIYKKRK